MERFFVNFYLLMAKASTKLVAKTILAICFYFSIGFQTPLHAEVRGIYINTPTILSKKKLGYLIQKSLETDITTFVIDMELANDSLSMKKYSENIALVLSHHLEYVARVAIFPGGATPEQVIDKSFWQKKLSLIKKAISLGAKAIQLDYIRYNTKQKPSPNNEKKIHEVISWFKKQLKKEVIPLQIDVFGLTTHGPMEEIGQNVVTFSDTIDVLCPMIYPSHFQPYSTSHKKPFETISTALIKLKEQFAEEELPIPFKVIPYIEVVNFRRHNQSNDKKIEYLKKQIEGVRATTNEGWYTWSAGNFYDPLFQILREEKNRPLSATRPLESSRQKITD